MNAGIHKLTAGDGYTYLIRQTAVGDGDKGRTSLSDYYTEKGETPGVWVGRGLAGLGTPVGRAVGSAEAQEIWCVEKGSAVTEDQMKALFGLGVHPNATKIVSSLTAQGAPAVAALEAAKLGRPFHINPGETQLQRRIAVAYRDHNLSRGEHWNAPIDEDLRAQIRTSVAREMFAAEHGRAPLDDRELTGYIASHSRELTTSVAGYDITFTPVKSVSTLWAIAPVPIAKIIEDCHNRAVADALEWQQDNAAFTRRGAGGVAQVDVDGFIAAQFFHRDSRAGDPGLHTHVAVSGKVRTTGPDGIPRWLAVDGRPLFKSTVATSEFYNTRIEGYLNAALGLPFADRPATERGKRPVREIVGIPVELNECFSKRRGMIEARYAELSKKFQADHGREPTTGEAIALSQQATLETRQAKHEPRSWAEQRDQWRSQAIETVGGPDKLQAVLGRVLSGRATPVAEADADWIAKVADEVIEIVSESRARWQRNHVYAEAQRQVRAHGRAADHTLAEAITAAALAAPRSIAHARSRDADMGEPAVLRRRDGSSVYSTHGTELFTSEAMLAAEQRIIAAAQRRDGRRVAVGEVDMALLHQAAARTKLNDGQEALVRDMSTSGARVALALAPAGTGKTTAMAVLTRAWEASGGTVIGLAPNADAAQILREEIDVDATDTVAKYVQLAQPDPRGTDYTPSPTDPAYKWFNAIGPDTLIIVDEAGKAGTFDLDAVIGHAMARGASVRLVGDDRQLASISAGGVLRDIAAITGALTLTEVVRFKSRSEAMATLALRDGDPSGIAFYADNHRIHVGADATAADMAYTAWQADRRDGRDTILMAPTNTVVAELNERARLDRLREVAALPAKEQPDPTEIRLADGLNASAGDTICTRRNARWLRLGRTDFVRNGYRWTVEKVNADGSIRAVRRGTGQRVTLPSDYISEHVTLGYASTIDTNQGVTADTCHIVGSDSLSRQLLYVALTRGRHRNDIYLSTAETDPHRILTPKATHPDTAVDVLTRALARDDAQLSATTEARLAEDPFSRLGPAADMYADAVGEGAEHLLGAAAVLRIEQHAETVHSGLTTCPAWPVLRKHLAVIALHGENPIAALTAAIDTSELDTAHDAAAVLDWRLDHTGAHSAGAGPLRWLTAIPQRLADHPDWGAYLTARYDRVADLAAQIRHTAQNWTQATAPRWARPAVAANPRLAAELAVFRAAVSVDEADTRLTGPPQYPVRLAHYQRALTESAHNILGRPASETGRFNNLVDAISAKIRQDSYWPQLATQLATAARTGVNTHQLLADAAAQGPLPDEMPAAALWWRLAGTLAPATLDIADTHLKPPWMADIHTVFGSAIAEAIAADPAFPGLVAAVGTANPAQWTPLDLLHVAYEHLRDADPDHTVAPHEYARLLTYSIDLFTTEHPFDADIPDPHDAPLSPEEEEELHHRFPDPYQQPVDLLDALGFTLSEPPDDDHIADIEPPDPLDYADLSAAEELGGLQFEDLATTRPGSPALEPAIANIVSLRQRYQQASDLVATLTDDIRIGCEPSVVAAAAEIADMRHRAELDRPYAVAIYDIMARWDDAQVRYDTALATVTAAQNRYDAVRLDPDADEFDVLEARADLKIATLQLPKEPPAQQFLVELTHARTARENAAGGPDKVIGHDDVDNYLAQLRADDAARLRDARAQQAQLRLDLERAEVTVAKAFAEASARSADHVTRQLTDLRAELRLLKAAGAFTDTNAITIDPDTTGQIPWATANRLAALAKLPFTVTPVTAAPGSERTHALHALHDAAHADDRKVLWLNIIEENHDADVDAVADTVTTLNDAHTRITDGAWQVPAGTVIIVDHAPEAHPAKLVDLAEHAATNNARILLLDPDTQRWPPGPSARLLRLLNQELPWRAMLTYHESETTTHAPSHSYAADLEPVLAQTQRLNPTVLTDDLRQALEQHAQITSANSIAHRALSASWTTRAQERNQQLEQDSSIGHRDR